MSKYKFLMIGLILAAFASSGITWIKQIQQKYLDEVQIQRVAIEAFSRNPTLESLQTAKEQTILSLKKLDQVPMIPWIAEPSKTIQAERHHLSIKIEQIEEKIAIINGGRSNVIEPKYHSNFNVQYNFDPVILQYNHNRQEWEKIN